MKIAVITEYKNHESLEDFYIAQSFAKDGHYVDLIPFNDSVDLKYDLYIVKNIWDEENFNDYLNKLDNFLFFVKKHKLIVINSLDGIYDDYGKQGLVDLFNKGFEIVPTINNSNDFYKLGKSENYIIKHNDGYSSFGLKTLNYEQAKKYNLNNEVMQPEIHFVSEVQFYFVNNKFQYALEYSPNKFPSYPIPAKFKPNLQQIKLAKQLIATNKLSCGFQRADFLKLKNDKLLLMEFTDRTPHLSFIYIDEKLREKTIKNYKKAVYNYYESCKLHNNK